MEHRGVNLNRRMALRRGLLYSGVAAGLSKVSGCQRSPVPTPPASNSVALRARVDVIRLTGTAGRDRIGDVAAGLLANQVAGRDVLMVSPALAGQPGSPIETFLDMQDAIACHLLTRGAKGVTLCSDVQPRRSKDSDVLYTDLSREKRAVKRVYCQMRFSGRLTLDVPVILAQGRLLVLCSLVSPPTTVGLSSFSSLGLINSDETRRSSPVGEVESLADLAINTVSTIEADYTINMVVTPASRQFAMVCGTKLASVDAMACLEMGIDPLSVEPLRRLPCWLGPVTTPRIDCRRMDV